MIDMERYLYERVKPIIEGWKEEGIYAISFFIETNLVEDNIPVFIVSYNTEADCEEEDELISYRERRWNYASWRQEETPVISDEESTQFLLDWFSEKGIKNVGVEEGEQYDEEFRYIGKGPNGLYELLEVITTVAKRLHAEEVIKNKFGKEIPIIVHDLEYPWYMIEATEKANPPGLVDEFIEAVENGFED
ncbi:hypothetical protein [Anaeromicropila populeti]|uniref:DUF4303 domain-containing protein n=1 Tax=Anaeromicropila populeti TaxID=37658 RepID=A0A1I6J7T0_9FIRM|nr:hypothetical protein [Anaeromicropila populeti]SFR75038.1 hypothetical protein SAMN05661086_01433 [Anaeromicropila populeti]